MSRTGIGALNSLELSIAIQEMEIERNTFLMNLLPLLDGVERLCRDLDKESAKNIEARAESLAALAEVMDKATISVELERTGKIGQPIDPRRHEVVSTRQCLDQPPATIVEVIEHGWVCRGDILRTAKVVTTQRPE